MTTEMGRSGTVELGYTERVAARSIAVCAKLMNMAPGAQRMRYDPQTATVAFSGESDYAGEQFQRGEQTFGLHILNVLIGFLIALLVFEIARMFEPGPVLSLVGIFVLLGAGIFPIVNAIGTARLSGKVRVVDYATKPTPDAIEDMQAAYLADEIDERELEAQAEEVWRNE